MNGTVEEVEEDLTTDLGEGPVCAGLILAWMGKDYTREHCTRPAVWRRTYRCCNITASKLRCNKHRNADEHYGVICSVCLKSVDVTWTEI